MTRTSNGFVTFFFSRKIYTLLLSVVWHIIGEQINSSYVVSSFTFNLIFFSCIKLVLFLMKYERENGEY